MSDHYDCPQCKGTGRVKVSAMMQETLDACRRIAAAGKTITMRSLRAELPRVPFGVLANRLNMLRRRGLIEASTTEANYYIYEVV